MCRLQNKINNNNWKYVSFSTCNNYYWCLGTIIRGQNVSEQEISVSDSRICIEVQITK